MFYLTTKLFITFEQNVVMFGDLVRVGFWEGKKDNMRMLIWVSGISLTTRNNNVFHNSRHSDMSIENETKVHCLYKTDCLRLVCLNRTHWACIGRAESTLQMWVCNIIQRAGWLRRLSQGAREGQNGSLYCTGNRNAFVSIVPFL